MASTHEELREIAGQLSTERQRQVLAFARQLAQTPDPLPFPITSDAIARHTWHGAHALFPATGRCGGDAASDSRGLRTHLGR
jgi:hypothetical protein